MIRFTFTPDAECDIKDIARYLQGLPQAPALRTGKELQQTIAIMTRFPGLGRIDERLTRLCGKRVLHLVSGK